MNLYFFGGTFDPPHLGHYNIVKKCTQLADKVVVVPNNISVDKESPNESFIHRFNMLKILLQDLNVDIDDFEKTSNKKNYTIYTIHHLLNKYKNAKITMIIGKDQFQKITHWYRSDDILNLVEILCFNRSVCENNSSEIISGCKVIEDFNYNISSTKLRAVLKNSNDALLSECLKQSVIDYIKENNLYAS